MSVHESKAGLPSCALRLLSLTQCMVRPCVASGFAELAVSGLASMYPAFDWSICSGPSWISARVQHAWRQGIGARRKDGGQFRAQEADTLAHGDPAFQHEGANL